jgi:TPR repeat protein
MVVLLVCEMCISARVGLDDAYGDAVRLYRLAADQGNAGGQCNLGFMYEAGLGGLPKDDREAVRLYRLAADQGYDEAKSSVERLTHPSPTEQRGIRKRAK